MTFTKKFVILNIEVNNKEVTIMSDKNYETYLDKYTEKELNTERFFYLYILEGDKIIYDTGKSTIKILRETGHKAFESFSIYDETIFAILKG